MYREQWETRRKFVQFQLSETWILKNYQCLFFQKNWEILFKRPVQSMRFRLIVSYLIYYPIHIKTRENIYDRKKSLESFS